MSAAASLALSGCGGAGSSVPSDPADAVAQALDSRLDDGFSFDVRFDLTEAGRSSLAEDADAERMVDLLTQGLFSGAFQQPDQFAFMFGSGALEVRTTGDAAYFKVDLSAMAEAIGEDAEIPSASELQAQLQAFGLTGQLATVAQAALNGEWVGLTGLTEEAMQQLEQLGGFSATPDAAASEDMREALEEAGLLDGEELTERYLIVTGGDGTYDIEIKARELLTALESVAVELEGYASGFTTTDMPDPEDVPERVGGITVTLDGDELDTVALDLVEFGSAFDEAAMAEEDIAEGDAVLVVDFDDVEDGQLGEPEGATTISFEQLVQELAPLFMGLMGGASGEY